VIDVSDDRRIADAFEFHERCRASDA